MSVTLVCELEIHTALFVVFSPRPPPPASDAVGKPDDIESSKGANPEYTHQVVGPSETIVGYKAPKCTVSPPPSERQTPPNLRTSDPFADPFVDRPRSWPRPVHGQPQAGCHQIPQQTHLVPYARPKSNAWLSGSHDQHDPLLPLDIITATASPPSSYRHNRVPPCPLALVMGNRSTIAPAS